MIRLFGIRPSRLLIAVAGAGVLVAGLVVPSQGLMVLGALLIVWPAAAFAASRRR